MVAVWRQLLECSLIVPALINPCFWLLLSVLECGGQGRNRTADASLFRAALYQLSYLARICGTPSLECSYSSISSYFLFVVRDGFTIDQADLLLLVLALDVGDPFFHPFRRRDAFQEMIEELLHPHRIIFLRRTFA